MAGKWASENLFRAIYQLCFFALFFQTLAFAEWIVISTVTFRSPIAHMVPYFSGLLVLEVIGLILYFRWPWVMVIASWVGVLLIVTRGIPWGTPQWRSSLHQFQFELFLLFFAHLGFGAEVLKNRAAAAEEAEAAAEPVAGADGGRC